MATAEELEAELEVVRLEEELRAAKESGDGPTREQKLALREARAKHRANRTPATEEGDATATPDVVATEGSAN